MYIETITTESVVRQLSRRSLDKLYKRHACAVYRRMWDSFQDPPTKKASGSSAHWKKLAVFLKLLKILTYIIVFVIVLMASVISKLTYIFMTGNLKNNTKVTFCAKRVTSSTNAIYTAQISTEEQIAWVWALIVAFAAPEVFTFLRALRICTFKDVKSPTWLETVLVLLFEVLHVIGLALLTFMVLPQLDATRASMICCCVCFVPALLNLLTGTRFHWRSVVSYALSMLALIVQGTAFLVWPALTTDINVQLLIIPLILISCRWWENYANTYPSIAFFTRAIRRSRSRYQTYLYLAPLKITVFALMAFALHGEPFLRYFIDFAKAWQPHGIAIERHALTNITESLNNNNNNNNINNNGIRSFTMQSDPYALLYTLLLQIFSAYLCYIFGKFACKIKIQEFSFALPLCLAAPVTVVTATWLAQLRAVDVCALHDYIPDYLTLQSIVVGAAASGGNFIDALVQYCLWLWPLWWLSQLWTCTHIWQPRNDRNAPTEKLFVCPWYCGLLVDQCVMMNRRIVDWNGEYLTIKNDLQPSANEHASAVDANGATTAHEVQESDKIPQLIVCATMWHETQEEMMEFLKSIVRLDEDQCARRMARIHINGGKADDEYYELESNIFFDDAFVLDDQHCENARNPPLNDFVKMLIKSIDKAAFEVYGVDIRIKPPVKIETPYGGRLVWTLPGRSKLIAHLKNKDKIRHKKRWSQVMYMYYLLGFRIMELDNLSPRRKAVIAENTFLLALDGDIDFQPGAVQLLIDRMKAIDELGAACGRIHPVGRGPMVWYQRFEYAIGHWLQKATEHVIGCVLCSPGCFSLFRASALMENSVMKKYTTVAQAPMDYVQYDQGEDRWLCTLLLKQGWRVEYSAASDAYTHSPEIFYEFYNQRRRWVPSTMANIFDILLDAETVVKNNSSISTPYIMYQAMLMVGTVLGPGTIFLMMVGALIAVFSIDIWTAFLWNFFPLLAFILACVYLQQKYQLLIAFVISTVYCLVMMAVLVGVVVQMLEDGPLAPASLFFLLVAVQITVAGLMHPQEVLALLCGIIYYITIPSMYMLLMIYSVFNMNDVSWGTREAPAPKEEDPKSKSKNNEEARSVHYQPGWLNDPILVDSELGEIPLLEKRFWRDLIKQYLKPLFHTKEEKAAIASRLSELRNMIAYAFVMVNSIFVLIVFLLQLKKDYLHLKWPIDPTDYVSFDRDNSQVFIYRQYKELDPIGLCFVVFFGFILIIQFIAMFFHRFATFSQLLATTKLDWFRSNGAITDEDAAQEIKGNAFNIARLLQRPKRLDDDDDDDDIADYHAFLNDDERVAHVDDECAGRRKTIFKLHEQRNKRMSDYSDLVKNFERRFFGDEDIKVKNLLMSRKSVMMLNERRSVAKHSLGKMTETRRNNDFNKQKFLVFDNPAFEANIEW